MEKEPFVLNTYDKIKNSLHVLFNEMNMNYEIENIENYEGQQQGNETDEKLLLLANNLLVQMERLFDELIEQYEQYEIADDECFVNKKLNKTDFNLNNKNEINNLNNPSNP